MPKRSASHVRTVREPVQVYLAADDSELLARVASDTGLSKAEVLRRGVRSFAREQGGASPMMRFVAESAAAGWSASANGVAADHDAVLAESYKAPRKKGS